MAKKEEVPTDEQAPLEAAAPELVEDDEFGGIPRRERRKGMQCWFSDVPGYYTAKVERMGHEFYLREVERSLISEAMELQSAIRGKAAGGDEENATQMLESMDALMAVVDKVVSTSVVEWTLGLACSPAQVLKLPKGIRLSLFEDALELSVGGAADPGKFRRRS